MKMFFASVKQKRLSYGQAKLECLQKDELMGVGGRISKLEKIEFEERGDVRYSKHTFCVLVTCMRPMTKEKSQISSFRKL